MEEEDIKLVEDLQNQLQSSNENLQKAQQGLISSSLAGRNDNLITYQLELNNILEKIEHLLRGDEIVMEDGNMYYQTTQNPELQFFNDYGVQLIMGIVHMYVNRNTLLSRYGEQRILQILHT